MKRQIRTAWIVVGLLLLVVSTAALAQDVVTLRWTTCCAQLDRHEMFQSWARRFEERHPNIRIEWSAPAPYGATIATQMAAGLAPDVAWLGTDFWNLHQFLKPLNHLLTEPDGPLADTFPAVFNFFTWQGKLGVAPYGANTVVMFVNKDMLAEVGHGMPGDEWTYDDLLDIGAKIVRTSAEGVTERWAVDLRSGGTQVMSMSFGGPPYSADGRQSLLNRPSTVAATQLFADLWSGRAGIQVQGSAYGDLYQQFSSGTTAMVNAGIWAVPFMRQQVNHDWDVVTMPWFDFGGEMHRNTFVSGEGWAIFESTQHPEEAELFLRFLLEPEQMEEFAQLGGIIPTQADITQSSFFLTDQRPANMLAFIDSIAFAQNTHQYHPAGAEVHRLIWPAVTQIYAGQVSAAVGFEEIERLSTQALDAYWSAQ